MLLVITRQRRSVDAPGDAAHCNGGRQLRHNALRCTASRRDTCTFMEGLMEVTYSLGTVHMPSYEQSDCGRARLVNAQLSGQVCACCGAASSSESCCVWSLLAATDFAPQLRVAPFDIRLLLRVFLWLVDGRDVHREFRNCLGLSPFSWSVAQFPGCRQLYQRQVVGSRVAVLWYNKVLGDCTAQYITGTIVKYSFKTKRHSVRCEEVDLSISQGSYAYADDPAECDAIGRLWYFDLNALAARAPYVYRGHALVWMYWPTDEDSHSE